MASPIYIGVDLTILTSRPSTLAIVYEEEVIFLEAKTLVELVNKITVLEPEVVAIDAPLQLPNERPFRDCDIKLKKMGLKPLPPIWRGMRKLTLTAIKIKKLLTDIGVKVIETFPSGSFGYKKIKPPKKLSDIAFYFGNLIRNYRLKVVNKVKLSRDILDSLICVLAAEFYGEGMHDKLEVVQGGDCVVVLPILDFF